MNSLTFKKLTGFTIAEFSKETIGGISEYT